MFNKILNQMKKCIDDVIGYTAGIGRSVLSHPTPKKISYITIILLSALYGRFIAPAYSADNNSSPPKEPPKLISESDHQKILEIYQQQKFNGTKIFIEGEELGRVLQEKEYSLDTMIQAKQTSSTEDSKILVQNSNGSVTNLADMLGPSPDSELLHSTVYATLVKNGEVLPAYSSLEVFMSTESDDPNILPLPYFLIAKDPNTGEPVCVGSVFTQQWHKNDPNARGGVVFLPPPVPDQQLTGSWLDIITGKRYAVAKGYDLILDIIAQDPINWLPINGEIVVEYIGDAEDTYLSAIGVTLFSSSGSYEDGAVLEPSNLTISGLPSSFLGPSGSLYVEASDEVPNIDRTDTTNFPDYALFASFYDQLATPAQGIGALRADLNNDGKNDAWDLKELGDGWLGRTTIYIDFQKFAELAGNWGKEESQGNIYFDEVDFDGSGFIDFGDLDVLSENWLTVYFSYPQ